MPRSSTQRTGQTGRIGPKETLHNLSWFIVPAFGFFIVAVMLGVLPRYLTGPTAADQRLHDLLSLGLLIGTLSMLVLASAMFCAGFIYATTRRLEQRYQRLVIDRAIKHWRSLMN